MSNCKDTESKLNTDIRHYFARLKKSLQLNFRNLMGYLSLVDMYILRCTVLFADFKHLSRVLP